MTDVQTQTQLLAAQLGCPPPATHLQLSSLNTPLTHMFPPVSVLGAPLPLEKGVCEQVAIMPDACYPWWAEPLVPRVMLSCNSFPYMGGLQCVRHCADCFTWAFSVIL